MATDTDQQVAAFRAAPQKEHEWLKRLAGEWSYRGEAPPQPGAAPQEFTGTETVRSIGDLWFVAEGRGETPGGGQATTLLTLGYDSEKRRYVGAWLGSMMTYLWVYDGEVDASGNALVLSCTGPDFETQGKTRQYEDVIEFQDDDHRTLTTKVLGNDGEWSEMMKVYYRRETSQA